MLRKFFSHWIVKNLLLAMVISAFLLIVVIITFNIYTRHNVQIDVPDFSNMTLSEASVIAENVGVALEVTDSVYVTRLAKGVIFKQNPAPGEKVKQGRRIMLTTNATTVRRVSMPNLVGYSYRQAKADLQSKGLRLGRIMYKNDIATNNVLQQLRYGVDIAPGTMVRTDSVIDLVLGLQPMDHNTAVPNLIGRKYQNAIEGIHDHCLNVGRLDFDESVKTYADSLNAVVYRQSPATPTAAIGSNVTIYLTTDVTKVPQK